MIPGVGSISRPVFLTVTDSWERASGPSMTRSTHVAPEPGSYIAASPAGFDYQCTPGVFDETIEPAGGLRPHWRSFFEQMGVIGLPELQRRWEEAKHLIHEHGVTYNVYGDPRGLGRPWELDPIPLLVAPADASRIESGLIQRALLLDRALADLYGPRTLLASGVLPPELVLGHPGFLSLLPWPERAGQALSAPLRRRPRQVARRDLFRAPRPHPGPFGRGLRAREPDRALADAARDLSRLPGPASLTLLPDPIIHESSC
jgi:hypothetical protein